MNGPVTLQYCIDNGIDLWVYCDGRGCAHMVEMPATVLVDRGIPGTAPLPSIKAGVFRCSVCRGRVVSVRPDPYPEGTRGVGR